MPGVQCMISLFQSTNSIALYDHNGVLDAIKKADYDELSNSIYAVVDYRHNSKHDSLEIEAIYAKKGMVRK